MTRLGASLLAAAIVTACGASLGPSDSVPRQSAGTADAGVDADAAPCAGILEIRTDAVLVVVQSAEGVIQAVTDDPPATECGPSPQPACTPEGCPLSPEHGHAGESFSQGLPR